MPDIVNITDVLLHSKKMNEIALRHSMMQSICNTYMVCTLLTR